ncbi:30S ribosomal protein S18 [Candidatus Aerophobetes bacterium Ae_b3b]|uniref:30S ribosomal protein S18 n=1 Tax=Aerophobetes bacterium TaxID=2030807 RepID=A0A523YRB2_UNCAE|nr:MAG: 30S ribosomal protein S18 [Candidatus Aerophobetes bacterium]TKJ46406.1 MAG: 30S ribosomal protein S18 [Candidatus Aerophobetes bacterium Ae_b3b]
MRPRPLLKKRRVCIFCRSRSDSINHLDVKALGYYIDSRARIKNRRRTGTCAKHQRKLSRAIKKAREMALLPYK